MKFYHRLFTVPFFLFLLFLFALPFSAKADIITGLADYYMLDEGTGTTTADSVGGNNGTLVNSPAWGNGRVNSAVDFDGTAGKYVGYNTNLSITGAMTVSAWVYPRSAPSGVGRVVVGDYCYCGGGTNQRGWFLWAEYGSSDLFKFEVYDSSGNHSYASISNFFSANLNKWTYVTGVFNPGSYVKLYVNGVQVASSISNIVSVVANDATTNLRIGSRADNLVHGIWDGLIDEVRVYNRALSVSDTTELYNNNGGVAPIITTGGASSISYTSVTLSGSVIPNNTTATVYFQYGTVCGVYSNQTASQAFNGLVSNNFSATVVTFFPNTSYCYRSVVEYYNGGISYGEGVSFMTLVSPDTVAPTGSVSINGNGSSSDSEFVRLLIIGSDDVGVFGYYISESNITPSLNDSNWKFVTPSLQISRSPGYSFSSVDGTKVVYVWFRDAGGNISLPYSDSITLVRNDSWKNFYTIVWKGTPDEQIKYAKQMGYDYIAPIGGGSNRTKYANNSNRDGLKFYLSNPETLQYLVPVIWNKDVNTATNYSQAQIDYFNNKMAWKSLDAFPNNLASGWFTENSLGTKYQVHWDLQQQAVIDYVVEQIVSLAKSYESTDPSFAFGGYIVDVPHLTGDFAIYNEAISNFDNTYVSLSYWTGSDSTLVHSGITHEYATYSEGMAAYYKRLNTRLKQEWPDSKAIYEPYRLYSTGDADEWVYQTKDRADKDELTPDMLSQESSGTTLATAVTEFVDDANIFNSGVNITKDRVGITEPNAVKEEMNRLFAAKAGINGAWYDWYGRFGNTGDMPDFNSITEVYPRLKLIRLIPNWDNLNNIPLVGRSWDGSVYQSVKDGKLQSYISSDLMYSRHWKTGKIFTVFNTLNGILKLNPNEAITSIQCVDGFFIESGDCTSDFITTDTSNGKQLILKSTVVIPTDTNNSQVKGLGYIITVATVISVSSSSSISTTVASGGSGGRIRLNVATYSSDSSQSSSSLATPTSSHAEVSPTIKNQIPNITTDTKQSTPISTPNFIFMRLIRYGQRGNDIVIIQNKLKEMGFFPKTVDSTGYFGTMTKQAVINYQKAKGLPATGQASQATLLTMSQKEFTAINKPIKEMNIGELRVKKTEILSRIKKILEKNIKNE